MARVNEKEWRLNDLRGGRNGWDSPIHLAENECVEATNIDWFKGKALGRVRGGTEARTTVVTRPAVSWCFRYQPNNSPIGTDTFFFAGGIKTGPEAFLTYASGTGDMGDEILVDTWGTTAASVAAWRAVAFNNKMILAGDTNVNRLHCWTVTGSDFRRMGLVAPAAAPTGADVAGGAGGTVLRYYKVAWAQVTSGVTERRSELSAALSYTPGAAQGCTVTRPTAAGEGETHWLLYGSADNSTYHLLATTAIATTTFDELLAPSAYTGDLPPVVGLHIPPPSCKYLLVANNRLIMAGAWETSSGTGNTTVKNNRVWFSDALGSSSYATFDEESLPLNNYVDINENDGDTITGLAGPLFGDIYVFKHRRTYVMSETGNPDAPYQIWCMSNSIGCMQQPSVVEAEDEHGAPAIYFYAQQGFFRIGRGGMQFIGRQVLDKSGTFQGDYWAETRQIWWLNDAGDYILCYQVSGEAAGAWSVFTGTLGTAKAFAMWSRTTSSILRPSLFIASEIQEATPTAVADVAEAIPWSLTTRPLGNGRMTFHAHEATLVCEALASTVASVTYRPNFESAQDLADTVSTAPVGTETRRAVLCDGLQTGGVTYLQCIVARSSGNYGGKLLDELIVPYSTESAT